MIGLKYCEKTDSAPVITCICMRHEMAYAKQLAFMFGKKIYYRSDFSAKLCSYARGEVLLPADYAEMVKLYIDYLKAVENKKDSLSQVIRISNDGLKICGHLFKPFFKLKELIWVIGEPDARNWLYIDEKPIELCSWDTLGLCTYSILGDKNYIQRVLICKKEISDDNIKPFSGKLFINGKPFDGKGKNGVYGYFEIEKDAFIVLGRKGRLLELCTNDDADFIAVEFGKIICFAVINNHKERLQKLIKEGHDKNCTAGYNEEPLLTVAITENLPDIVKILIDARADVNKPSRWGITPLMRAVLKEEAEYVRLLIDAGSDKNIRDKNGFSALDYAKMHKVKPEIVALLKARNYPKPNLPQSH